MKQNYKFDLKKLEDDTLDTHKSWQDDDNQDSRTALFFAIKELAFAILSVGGWEQYDIDFELGPLNNSGFIRLWFE